MHFYDACSFALTSKDINPPVTWDGETKDQLGRNRIIRIDTEV